MENSILQETEKNCKQSTLDNFFQKTINILFNEPFLR
jgi:hypothetical protein